MAKPRISISKKFFLKKEICNFMEMNGKVIPKLYNNQWVVDLGFLNDLTTKKNLINTHIQKKLKFQMLRNSK